MGGVASFFYDEAAATEPPPQVEKQAASGLVQMEEMIVKKGSVNVTGRYTTDRELEQDYVISDKVLGTGMSGPVRLAEGKSDGRKYAVKSFRKSGLSASSCQDLKNEAELYLQLDHPHIAQLSMVFETAEVMHLVMEYMEGGELYGRLASQRRYTEEAAADTTYQMLLAVAYLHCHKIAHRDLKLENFLYERKHTSHLKLIDFGFAKFWDPSTMMSHACGSIHYVAPEVLMQSYTVQADMWSLGVIAYMLLTGTPAFHGPDRDILRRIKAGRPHFSSRFMTLSEPAQDFVRSLLVKNPTERLSAASALEHPWIKGRHVASTANIDASILGCLRTFAEASRFRRAALSLMAWSLSTEEQQELREQFILLDREKNGRITLNQLKLVLQENFDVDGEEAERLFSMIDSDNSQEIEYSEFLAAALMGRVNVHEDVLRRTFSRFDRDDSGRISEDELRTVLGSCFGDADMEELIREVDTSGDGQVDYDEFLAYFTRFEPLAEESAQSPAQGPTVRAKSEAEVECRRKTQRHRMEKLTGVIDQLLSSSSIDGAEDEASSLELLQPKLHSRSRSHLDQPRVSRRSQTAPVGLPTLLRTLAVHAEEKEREEKA